MSLKSYDTIKSLSIDKLVGIEESGSTIVFWLGETHLISNRVYFGKYSMGLVEISLHVNYLQSGN